MNKKLGLLLFLCASFVMKIDRVHCGLIYYYDKKGVLHITNTSPRTSKGKRKYQKIGLLNMRLTRIWGLVEKAAKAAELDPMLLAALVIVESNGDQNAISQKGARGLTQLMPQTARELGVDPDDPGENLLGGAWYLRSLLEKYEGDLILALAAYNAGPGVVSRAGTIPNYKETRQYIKKVLLTWKQLKETFLNQ